MRRVFSGFVVALFVCHNVGAAWAIGVPPKSKGQSAPTDTVLADGRLTVFARQALQQDLLLSPLNLGVTVQGRTATVWGTIHSADLSHRAEAVVRKVPGIASVRNDLRIERPMLAAKGQLIQTLSPARPESLPDDKRRTPDSLAKFTGWGPPRHQVDGPSPSAVSLGAPIARAPIAPIANVTHNDLESAATKLRDSDDRYRQLRVDIEGGVLHLRGTVRRWEDAFDLASALSRLPGVERVVMGQVSTNRLQSLQVP